MYLVKDQYGNYNDVLSGMMEHYGMTALEAFESFIGEQDPRFTGDEYQLVEMTPMIIWTAVINADNVEAFLNGELHVLLRMRTIGNRRHVGQPDTRLPGQG